MNQTIYMVLPALLVCGFQLLSAVNAAPLQKTGTAREIRHAFGGVTVIEKPSINNDTVDFVVVKRKDAKASGGVFDTMFTLRNQENCFLLNLFGTFLFLDYGTGPDARTVSVYNVASGKKVLDTLYWGTVAPAGKDSVSLWLESGDTAVSKCPEYRKWTDGGLGAAIVKEHYFDLRSLTLYPTTHWKCEPLQ